MISDEASTIGDGTAAVPVLITDTTSRARGRDATLTDDAEITYKMSDNFSPEHYLGLLWSDPDLDINWPVRLGDAIVSDKDSVHPGLKDLRQIF